MGSVIQQSSGFFFVRSGKNDPKISAIEDAMSANWIEFNSTSNQVFSVSSNGIVSGQSLSIYGTTNQIIFGLTNNPPASTTLVLWVSVQVSGDTNIYRLGLAK